MKTPEKGKHERPRHSYSPAAKNAAQTQAKAKEKATKREEKGIGKTRRI
jgi:hypothetical protein